MTSTVDPSFHDLPLTRPTAGTTAGQTQANRQGWLKAMEASGLQEALKNTRAFEGTQSRSWNSGDGALPDGPPSGNARHVAADAVGPAIRNAQSAPALPEATRAAGGSLPLMATASETSPDAIAGYIVEGTRDALAARSGGARPAAGQDTAFVARKEWSARNLLLLPAGGGGIEVWVRDARMPQERIQMLLSDLRRAAAELGGGVVKLYVNGQPVQPANDGRPRQGE